jgi:hypothetical protein
MGGDVLEHEMTSQEQIAQLTRQLLRQRNANAALTVLCDGQKACIKSMAIDNNRQRDTMECAADKLASDSLKSSRREAEKLLRDELIHREKTREQRKGRAA